MECTADDSFAKVGRSGENRVATSRRSVLKTTGAGVLGAIGLGVTGGTTAVAASSDEFEASIDPEEGDDFNYTYHVYGPPRISDDQERPLLVMPYISPEPADDLGSHVEAAEELIEGYAKFFAHELEVPVLVPVVPWFETDPEDKTHCVPALDAETMALDEGALERFDEQLLAAIDDAADRLTDEWHPVADGILLNGFRFSGLFVNRFAALHPERVRAVAAGGFSGTALLPQTEANDTTLNYPLGVADVDDLVDEAFDQTAFADVDQFLYMGDEFDFDLVDNRNVWNTGQAQDVNDVYGDEPLSRFDHSKDIYEKAGVEAQFEVYDDTHQFDARYVAEPDILSHFRPHVGVTAINIRERPDPGAESIEVEVAVPSDHDPVDVRAFRWDGTVLTDQAITVQPGQAVVETVELTDSLKAGDGIDAVLLEQGVTDPDEALRRQGRPVDATHVEFRRHPTDGDDFVEVFATVSDDDLETYDWEVELRIVDTDGVELSREPEDVGGGWGGSVSLSEELAKSDEITAAIQGTADEDDEETVLVSETTTVVGNLEVTVPERPDVGSESVEVDVEVPATRDDGVDVRAFRFDGSDLTADTLTVAPGDRVQSGLDLTDELQTGDILQVALFEKGDDDVDKALRIETTAADATYATFWQQPSDGDEIVFVDVIVSDEDLNEHGEVEARVIDEADDELTEEPIPIDAPFYSVPVGLTTELTEGEKITLVVQPQAAAYDPGETLISSEPVAVTEDGGATASFTFSPESPDVETEVTFDASASEPAEEVEHYLWDFTGDREIDTVGIEASHTFTDPGDHEVTLFILDDEDNILDTTTETVNVREGCFIATAACGTPDHDQVETLRAFRDSTLKGNTIGELFVRLYYATSPPIADWIARSSRRRSIVRSAVVRPAARLASVLGLNGSDA